MLYKYLGPERIDVVERLQIRFTQPGALNDPFELRPRLESLVPEAEALAHLSGMPEDFAPMLRQAYGMLPEEHRALLPFDVAAKAFSSFIDSADGRSAVSAGLLTFLRSMRDRAPSICDSIYDALNRNIGILSLTEAATDLLMWAHYGDSHRGFLLGFDDKHPFFNQRRSENDECYFLRPVVYADLPPVRSVLALDGNTMFVTKGLKWAYEREWRMLAPLEDATRTLTVGGDRVHLFSFPPAALEFIIIGARATPELQRSLEEILRSSSDRAAVRVSRAVLDRENQRVLIR
jgi:hypothetical protein